MAIKSVTITSDQSLFDITLQYYGDVTKVYDLIALNDWIPSVMYNNLKGKTLNYEEQNTTVTNYFKANKKTIISKFPQLLGTYYSEEFLLSIDEAFKKSLENT
jgi:hypothetical protein